MSLQFYNSMNRCLEEFCPINPQHIRMYVCGPTVYDRIHLGNARPIVIFDILYRLLRYHYSKVTYVRNITDVDDKINQRALECGIPIETLTLETTQFFHQDIQALGVLNPDYEPRATNHIQEMIQLIELLIQKKHAYVADHHVLFDVDSFKAYGDLSHRNLEQMIAGARVEVASYKKNPYDFVLWKPSDETQPGWDSPWGYGRPGWHIECSAMSQKYLGQSFDIHGGGRDLLFPHHENEIAQSKACFGPDSFAKYWLHNEMITVNGEKMSKSLGNFVTLHDVLRDYHGEVIRFTLLSTHYRKLLDWTKESLEHSKKLLDKFYTALEGYTAPEGDIDPRIIEALDADLNTPLALSYLHDLATHIHKSASAQDKHNAQRLLKGSGLFLGLFQQSSQNWFHATHDDKLSVEDIERLIEQRALAKAQKDFLTADAIRARLEKQGIILLDHVNQTTWRRK